MISLFFVFSDFPSGTYVICTRFQVDRMSWKLEEQVGMSTNSDKVNFGLTQVQSKVDTMMNLMGQLKENAKYRVEHSNTNETTLEKEHDNEDHGYEYDYYVSDVILKNIWPKTY